MCKYKKKCFYLFISFRIKSSNEKCLVRKINKQYFANDCSILDCISVRVHILYIILYVDSIRVMVMSCHHKIKIKKKSLIITQLKHHLSLFVYSFLLCCLRIMYINKYFIVYCNQNGI